MGKTILLFEQSTVSISLSLMKMVKSCGFYCPIMHSIVICRNACHIIAELIVHTYMPTTLISIHIKLQVLIFFISTKKCGHEIATGASVRLITFC